MYKGVYTALVTPFDKNGNLDEEKLRELVNFQIKNKIGGLVPAGTTGESPTLTHDEHRRVLDIVVEEAGGRVPVIAGTGSNSTAEAVSLTKYAQKIGADGALVVSPYYNKPTQAGLYSHFKAIADSVEIPIIVYNILGRTAVNVETSTLMRLVRDCKNIAGVKEASGNLAQMMDVISSRPDGFTVLSGDDNLTLPLLALGGDGVISVASNIVPAKMVQMVDMALNYDFSGARKMHYELLPLFKAIFIETNPIPVKAAMAMKGMINETYRLPMCEMQAENREKLRSVLAGMKII